jgi:succinate dehydrogenase / fumarate reductase flavoprotein subunit
LKEADQKIVELLDRYNTRQPEQTAASGPTPALPSRASLKNMLELSRTVVLGSALCATSHAAHTTSRIFPKRIDEQFLKTTKASFTGCVEGPKFEYEEVDTQFIKPRPRRYDAVK